MPGKFTSDGGEIIDFTIISYRKTTISRVHGLATSIAEINDGEPFVAEPRALRGAKPRATSVWPAMVQAL